MNPQEADEILDDIIKTIDSGRYKGEGGERVESLYQKLKELRSSGEKENLELRSVFANHPGLFNEVVGTVAEKVLKFVDKQLAHFKEIRKQREFTREERSFACDCLVPLLRTLSELVGGRGTGDESGGGRREE